ncbi:G1/S-specific cyclin-E isoform X2 [Hermetia illucens]|uniref:G1/S-specific cyclin-E isoform X2 n=1 Tax=Hermetia illucens TaxID=343691 RepID=UPI0018CC31AD|nr:G1/S-specific cyclin-E isoform X2 [Hermetia illucens]
MWQRSNICKINIYEYELQQSAKRRNISPCNSPVVLHILSNSSSEISSSISTAVIGDTLRTSMEDNADSDDPGRPISRASSPLFCHSNATCRCVGWHTRGDVTPHGKQPCRRLRESLSPEIGLHCCIKPTAELRACPLPALSWANALDVWKVMCQKDEAACAERSARMLENHPGLQPRMRAILLDWLIEVCEVYKLHRETYYLAVDYLDRYLSGNKKIQKTHLQLIGITCLFVAAKVEEIYPPKIGEFAYVTDGACQEEDILQQELLLLKALDWNISPVTILGWLGVYMQLKVSNRTPASFVNRDMRIIAQTNVAAHKPDVNTKKESIGFTSDESYTHSIRISRVGCKRKLDDSPSCSSNTSNEAKSLKSGDNVIIGKSDLDDAFIYPQFSGLEFVQTAQLIDLCSLDLGFANFSYSVIAAAAISHTFTWEIAVRVSGFDWNVIAPCSQWMAPFFDVTREESQHLHLLESNEQVKSKYGLGHICPNIVTDDSHIIQTHTTSIDMFDKAITRRDYYLTTLGHNGQESSPALPPRCPEGLLTPPSSSRKSLDVESEAEASV